MATLKDSLSQEQVDLLRQYQQTFKSKDGQAILNDLARKAGRYETNFVPDSDRTVFNCGMEALFIYIQRQVQQADLLETEIQQEGG